jgi:hypothetical protein
MGMGDQPRAMDRRIKYGTIDIRRGATADRINAEAAKKFGTVSQQEKRAFSLLS